MRRASRSLTDVRGELVQIQEEFTRLQKRIEAARDSVADALTRIFGEQRPAMAALAEEGFIERIAGRVTARLDGACKASLSTANGYVNDVGAAKFLGVSAYTLRAWRSKKSPLCPPVTRLGKMVMYSIKELERFMEKRTEGI